MRFEIARIAASVWAVAFALVHVYWLLGGPWGLPPDVNVRTDEALFIASALAVPLLLAAAGAALVAGGCSVRMDRWSRRALLVVAVFGLLHGGPSLLLGALDGWGGGGPRNQRDWYALAVYAPNWVVGGLAFLAAWFESGRADRSVG